MIVRQANTATYGAPDGVQCPHTQLACHVIASSYVSVEIAALYQARNKAVNSPFGVLISAVRHVHSCLARPNVK